MVRGMLRSAVGRPARTGLAATLVAAVLLAGCSGGGGSDAPESDGSSEAGSGGSASAGESGSPSDGPSNYLDVGKKVVLTPQGTELAFGKKASVAWQLDEKRVAVVDLRVTKVERVPISRLSAWILDKKSKASTPYFVHLKVQNIGRSNLTDQKLPLYINIGKDSKGADRLVAASSFESTFKPCPSPAALPAKFRGGASTVTCLVYLAPDHGKLENVSVFTGPGFTPVTWQGDVVVVTDKKDDKGKGGKGDQKGDKKGQGKKGDKSSG